MTHAVYTKRQILGDRRCSRLSPIAAACALLAFKGTAAAAPNSDALLSVTVVSAETSFPLENARIALEPMDRESLSNADGRAVFGALPAGRYHVRARRIGYVPSDTALTLADGEQRQVRIVLVHAVVMLSAVRVVTYPPCRKPGLPDRLRQPELADLLVQMRLNAEQFRFLLQSRPIEYTVQRTTGVTREQSGSHDETTDTVLTILSRNGWRYRAGRVVTRDGDAKASREQVMHLPKLDDLASEEFLKNHCFFFAGRERMEYGAAIRIDFRASDRIRAPDVHGSVWLDSATFMIRSESLELSRIPRELRDVTSVRATTTFREIGAGIPLFDTIDGVTTLRRGLSKDPVIELTESQKLLHVRLTPS